MKCIFHGCRNSYALIGNDPSSPEIPYLIHLREGHEQCALTYHGKLQMTLRMWDQFAIDSHISSILFDQKYFLVKLKVKEDCSLSFQISVLAFKEEAKKYYVTVIIRNTKKVCLY